MRNAVFFVFLTLLLISANSYSQCDFNPTIVNPRISGSSLVLCNNDSQLLTTQSYDSYQWYKQQWSLTFPNPNPWLAVMGGTTQNITVTNADNLYNFKVLANQGGCSAFSPEILVDGFAYALPYIISEFIPGTFEQISSGEFRVCNGADVIFSQGFPALYEYHRWYKCMPSDPNNVSDPCVIQGVTGDTYTTTESGEYFFYCCTGYCPNMCEWLGVSVHLYFGNYSFCAMDTENIERLDLSIYPNPVSQLLHINTHHFLDNYVDLAVYNLAGVQVLTFSGKITSNTYTFDISALRSGEYVIVAKTQNKVFRNPFIKN